MQSRLDTFVLFATISCGICGLAVTSAAQHVPLAPVTPAVPAVPAPPQEVAMPAFPAFPALPALPAMPGMPALPAIPAVPAMPHAVTWDFEQRGHGRSITTGGHHGPINDCSDLHIQFDDRDAVVKSEERTITKGEAPTLKVRPHSNGGVQVQGWDKDTYSVTACKAAADYEGQAQVTLAKITLTAQNGEVSTDGPNREDNDWTVYLLIRAPKAASIDIETTNGPLSVYTVDGRLTARATNGPISLQDFAGDADVTAQNGPISISGSSGNIRIHTENGPISVDLKGTTWSGAGLSADAKNGPLTLFVPSDYQSSFVVESRNYSPMNCHAAICDNARKTWDENNRRIEFGNSPAMIHLSTVNGPVSVRSSRDEM